MFSGYYHPLSFLAFQLRFKFHFQPGTGIETGNLFSNFSVLVNSLSSDSNCGHSGSWVIAVPKSGIECNQQFETECPEPTQGDRATWTGIMKTDSSSDSTQWVFEAHHHCLPKHSISRNHRTSIIQCLYDADYYDSRWSIEPPSCQGNTLS